MSETAAVTQWIEDLDDPARRELAAEKIVRQYTSRLLGLIHRKLHRRFKGVLDTADVAQSVWRCFFNAETRDVGDRSELLALLMKIAVNRDKDAARRLDAANRDRRREQQYVSESDAELAGGRIPKPATPRLRLKGEPSPPPPSGPTESCFATYGQDALQYMVAGADAEVAACIMEMFESLPLDLQQVLAMDVEGYSRKEIAEKLDGCDMQTVRRKMERIRRRLEAFQAS